MRPIPLFFLALSLVTLIGCGKPNADSLLNEYERLCLIDAAIMQKIINRGVLNLIDSRTSKEISDLKKEIKTLNNKIELLEDKNLTGAQQERLFKIASSSKIKVQWPLVALDKKTN